MMTSYLGIYTASQLVLQYNMPDLLHLIGFGFAALGLQVQDFLDTLFPENVMTAANSLSETQTQASG